MVRQDTTQPPTGVFAITQGKHSIFLRKRSSEEQSKSGCSFRGEIYGSISKVPHKADDTGSWEKRTDRLIFSLQRGFPLGKRPDSFNERAWKSLPRGILGGA